MPGTPTLFVDRLCAVLQLRRILPIMFGVVLTACGSQQAMEVQPTVISATSVATMPMDIAPTMEVARNALAKSPLTLVFDNRRWQPSAHDLGASVIASGDALQVTVDQTRLKAYLAEIGNEIAIPAQDAQVQLVGETLMATASSPGRALDLDAAVAAATQALESAKTQQIALKTADVAPTITEDEAAAAIAQAQALMARPFELTLSTVKRPYTWDAVVFTSLLAFTPSDGVLQVGLDADRLAERVELFADRTEKKMREPRVAWNNGDLNIVGPGTPGARVDGQKMVAALLANFAGNTRTLALQTTPIQPTITASKLDSLGIKELVSVGKSDFTGSAEYRITNIITGMRILDGTLIPPGEEFSFNNTIGEIDATNGFVEGYAIIQNRTQLEFGGGICQDSTTVFRAAFWAGLPITERKEHTYYISWYDKYGLGPQGSGPGLDAAIFTGVQDLKFVNDTGAWLLMQATADTKQRVAQVALYGTKPNRSVSITHEIVERTPAIAAPEYFPDPKQPAGTIKRTDTARGGMVIEVYRTVVDNNVKRAPELFRTNFRPWSNKYAVNPRDLGPNGIPVFLNPTAVVTPTIDPLMPTIDPNMPPVPTIDPSVPPASTVDPAVPTVDPAAPPAPTPDPTALPADPADPNLPPAPTPEPVEPTADSNVPSVAPSG